jgi:hypothetical protein
MAKPRFLTKSRFKTGHECATKLHYLDDPNFANNKSDDAFLKALADGGYQVGELAKIYHPKGIQVTERDHQVATQKTQELLKKDIVTIFEAAFMYKNLFVRVDVLVKKGNAIRLLEVKSSSWKSTDSLLTKKGFISSDWEEYVADIAFQRYVVMKVHPEFKYACDLLLADKEQEATVNGIHQRFRLKHQNGQTSVEVAPHATEQNLGTRLLKEVSADVAIEAFLSQDFDGRSFEEYVDALSKYASDRTMASPKLSRACGKCEYRVLDEDLNGQSSGFLKCWTNATKHKEAEFSKPMIFDIWKLHFMKKDSLLLDRRYFMSEVMSEDIGPEDDIAIELSSKQRQWLQVEYFQKGNTKPFFDKDHFEFRMKQEKWQAPYHFIDFETLTPAIPLHEGMFPYETIAFQFSHHVMDAKGNLSHRDEYINVIPGAFPNFEFLRKLKAALDKDDGTIFRYSPHENTVLNHIRTQLLRSSESDRDALIAFIESVTYRKENKKTVHEGKRQMVDMYELVLKYYYSPLMGGSNSIKAVLPAALTESKFLKDKYSKPIYGTASIPSHNFQDKLWIVNNDGKVQDPYTSLPPLFKDVDQDVLDRMDLLYDEEDIREGGSASVAYARMQFTEMGDQEREEIKNALLRYCELDTLAMAMIWEYWTQELLRRS